MPVKRVSSLLSGYSHPHLVRSLRTRWNAWGQSGYRRTRLDLSRGSVVEGFEQPPTAINLLFDEGKTGKLVVKL